MPKRSRHQARGADLAGLHRLYSLITELGSFRLEPRPVVRPTTHPHRFTVQPTQRLLNRSVAGLDDRALHPGIV